MMGVGDKRQAQGIVLINKEEKEIKESYNSITLVYSAHSELWLLQTSLLAVFTCLGFLDNFPTALSPCSISTLLLSTLTFFFLQSFPGLGLSCDDCQIPKPWLILQLSDSFLLGACEVPN